MASFSSAAAHRRPKVVVIIGATGCGKSRLSIDVASHFPSEVINSDKTQVYRGLDITTNKIAPADRRGFPHHPLGSLDPDDGEMTPSQFRSLGDDAISDVASRGNLPILALLAERETRLEVRLLLSKDLPKRVDRMLRVGAFDELVGYYDLRRTNPGAWAGLRKAIGVLEFDRYFEKYPPPRGVRPGDAWGRAGGEQPSGCLCRRHNSEVPRL
ncbi:hypothetical protein ACJRO7_007601 [Eucalyptus globulus]|uniref:Uncharacterized protein n=1 Tax=Eucalyptus globulus TaxID=34317 RepID=A0ABD3INY7_EUCGL